ACTRELSALPCADSASMRWMLTNAYFAPVGNGASAAGAAGGAAGAAAGAWAKVGAAASITLRAAATTKALITVIPFVVERKTDDFNTAGPPDEPAPVRSVRRPGAVALLVPGRGGPG